MRCGTGARKIRRRGRGFAAALPLLTALAPLAVSAADKYIFNRDKKASGYRSRRRRHM